MGSATAMGGYRPVDPAAYAGRRRVRRRDVVRAVGIQALLVLVLLAWHGPVMLVLAGTLTLLNARFAPWPWAARGTAPFVVDRPGAFVAGSHPDEPGRLVHWESIEAIVRCEVTSLSSAHRRGVPGVALRLRSHPEVVAIRRPLDGWELDTAQLLAAVTRFAPHPVQVADGPSLASPWSVRVIAESLSRSLAGSAVAFAARSRRRRRARRHPAATGGRVPTAGREAVRRAAEDIARGTLARTAEAAAARLRRSDAGVTTDGKAAPPPAATGPAGARDAARRAAEDLARRTLARTAEAASSRLRTAPAAAPVAGPRRHVAPAGVPGGEPWLLVDARGVYLGAAGRRPGRGVPWRDISAVAVFDVEDRSGWHRAVGLVPHDRSGRLDHRVAYGWTLDRARLENAVRLHAPHVPVVDGPPTRRARVGDLAAALVHSHGLTRGQGVSVTRTARSRSGSAFTSSERGSPTSR